MKRIIIYLVILLAVVIFGCSKDHNAPTFSTFSATKKPTNIDAIYDETLDVVKITWSMPDTSSIVDYYITVSDSSDFDYGNISNKYSYSRELKYNFDVKNYLPADKDSTILYFNVSATYRNAKLESFIGPRSDIPDSAMIKRK